MIDKFLEIVKRKPNFFRISEINTNEIKLTMPNSDVIIVARAINKNSLMIEYSTEDDDFDGVLIPQIKRKVTTEIGIYKILKDALEYRYNSYFLYGDNIQINYNVIVFKKGKYIRRSIKDLDKYIQAYINDLLSFYNDVRVAEIKLVPFLIRVRIRSDNIKTLKEIFE